MRGAWPIAYVVFGLSCFASAVTIAGHRPDAEPRIASLQVDIDRIQVELEKSKKETEVEYWSHQCERETARALKRCGCAEVVP